MHLFRPDGVIKKYDNPEQIIEDFYGIRLELYKKRKRVLLENLEYDLNQLELLDNKIIVINRKRVELYLELQQKGFDLIPPEAKNGAATSEPEDAEEDESDKGVLARGYAYLLTMAIGSLTIETLEAEVAELKSATEKSLWLKDLEAFEIELNEQDARDIKAEEERKAMKSKVMKDAGMNAGKQAPKNPRKCTKKASTSASVAAPPTFAMEIDNVSEVRKPKGRGAPKKAPAKAKPASVDTDEEDDLTTLIDFHGLSSFDSSTDKATDTENNAAPAKKKPVAKRASAAQKKTTTVISTDDEQMQTISEEGSDDDFEPPAAVPAGRNKAPAKPAASKEAVKQAAAPPTSSRSIVIY
ncbi:hypothetical protein MKW92_051345 [Papaver armeniacum]|nr:hypothetical protein MKW92_051345 [Papaver armeniacum]